MLSNRLSFSDPKSPYGFMDIDLFKELIDQIEESSLLTFASRGEPTLHPKFLEILTIAKINSRILSLIPMLNSKQK